ncbi:MAG: ACT domain-containing protein [Anaerolineae bacterium]
MSTCLHRIITRGLSVAGRIVQLQVRLRDVPGTLTAVLEVVKRLQTNILDIAHHRLDSQALLSYVDVSLTLETKGHPHIQQIKEALQAEGYLLP